MRVAESGHLERVGYGAAGLVGNHLQILIGVIVRNEDGILLLQQCPDFAEQGLALARFVLGACDTARQRVGDAGRCGPGCGF
mgnify:CR=1 FL=1